MAQPAYSLPMTACDVSESGTGIHILVVEDDSAYRCLCVSALEESPANDYVVLEAGCAQEALDIMQSNTIDCAIIDYGLPDATGAGLIRTIRETLPDWLGPIIVMTSGGSEDVAAEVLRAGAADYIPKQRIQSESLHRALDNALEKAHLEKAIHQQNKELVNAVDQLEKRTLEITRFYHSISHEIKTPLTAARMFMSILSEGLAGKLNPDQVDLVDQAIESCDELASHFNDLVECTRLETGKITLKKSDQSTARLIHRSLVSTMLAADAKSLTLVEEVEDDLPTVHVDAGRMVQVLANLIGNAVKFTEFGGKVCVSARQRAGSPGSIEIKVADNGIGIDEKHLPNIFDRLYQAGSNGDALMGAGLGLGLTIAKEIIELHGGTISVSSKIGQGTTFTVCLPVGNAK